MEEGKISHNKDKVSQNKSVNMSQRQNSQVQDLSFEDAAGKYKHTEEQQTQRNPAADASLQSADSLSKYDEINLNQYDLAQQRELSLIRGAEIYKQIQVLMQEYKQYDQMQLQKQEIGQVESIQKDDHQKEIGVLKAVQTFVRQHRELCGQINHMQAESARVLNEKDSELQQIKLQMANDSDQYQAKIELLEMRLSIDLNSAEDKSINFEEEEEFARKRKQSQRNFSKSTESLKSLLNKLIEENFKSQFDRILNDMQELMNRQTADNKEMQLSRIKKDSKVKQYKDNINFLETKISHLSREKEETVIQLKSEIILAQQKAQNLEGQILQQQQHFEAKNKAIVGDMIAQTKKSTVQEMVHLTKENKQLKEDNAKMSQNVNDCNETIKQLEKEISDTISEKDQLILNLTEKLQQIDQQYAKKLTKIGSKKNQTQKRLNIEEKERELFGLKLEQVMLNNKKLMLQKKFLEKQLEKDLREIQLEMNKIQIEIQQDQMITPGASLQKFKGVYQVVSEQLTYIQQIVGFMDFDSEGLPVQNKNGGQNQAQPIQYEEVVKEYNEVFQKNKILNEQQQMNFVGGHKKDPSVSLSIAGPNLGQDLVTPQIGGDQPGDSSIKGTNGLKTQTFPRTHYQSPQRNQAESPARMMAGVQSILTVDECLQSYPYELLYALLEQQSENLKDATITESEHMQRLRELIKSNIDRSIVNEICDKFLQQNRIMFSQYLYKLKEKCNSFELELKNVRYRKSFEMAKKSTNLEDKLNEANNFINETDLGHQQFKNYLQEDDKILKMRKNQDDLQFNLIKQGILTAEHQKSALDDDVQDKNKKATENNKKTKVNKSELEQQIDVLKLENIALKERCKEIRLNLQRKITELQDTLIISKQNYISEINELKVEYGKDLNRITLNYSYQLQDLQEKHRITSEEKRESLNKDFKEKEAQLREQITQNEKKTKEAIEQAEINVRDAEKDLKKLKKESTGYFNGGWGTFNIAFEDNKLIEGGSQLRMSSGKASPSAGISGYLKAPAQSRKSFKNAKLYDEDQALKSDSRKKKPRQDVSKQDELRSQKSAKSSFTEEFAFQAVNLVHPIEKVSHFVEVGFLIDRKNFRLLNTFEETTLESNLKKYLFELQDSLDNYQMNDLEFKIKQQLSENVGLFNEINPVYVSLNMGRPSTPFFDDYVSQEMFRLVKREGLYLNGDRWLMINFLKCDYQTQHLNKQEGHHGDNENLKQQKYASGIISDTYNLSTKNQNQVNLNQYLLRVIAFENSNNTQFSFDLNFNDLITLMHGNIKLLEDENSHDLCQIILNNLSIIKREKVNKLGKTTYEDVLIVEHKIFFNEQYRSNYDKKNKMIFGKYDKKRQGLVKDVCVLTDFDRSVIYEAFIQVYNDQINLNKNQDDVEEDNLQIEIQRGIMSGNIKLTVSFIDQQNLVPKEMCIFAEDLNKTHKICSEIIHVNDQQYQQVLAYVLSLEKVYGVEDILVVRLVSIQKQDQQRMSEYSWNPEDRPNEGSTQFTSETLYLVKKSDGMYCRVYEYEILNTEARTQLFMHSYGYIQSNIDFGNIRHFFEQSEKRRQDYVSTIGNDEYCQQYTNVNISQPALLNEYKGQNQLIYRSFCQIRVQTQKIYNFNEIKYQVIQDITIPQLSFKSSDIKKQQNEMEKYSTGNNNQESKRYYALVSIFEDGQCISNGQLIIKCVIQDLQIDIIQEVDIDQNFFKSDGLKNILNINNKVALSESIIDQLYILNLVKSTDGVASQDFANGDGQSEGDRAAKESIQPKYIIKFEKDMISMKNILQQQRQKRFEDMLRNVEGRHDDDKIKLELKDVSSLKISFAVLGNSPKAQCITLINQISYKVTAYFVSNQRGFEPAIPHEQRVFDWHLVYLEFQQKSTDQQFIFVVTETDLASVQQKLRQKLRVESKELKKDLIYKEMTKDQILNLILDCLLMNPQTLEISLSMLHLNVRYQERQTLQERFLITGGRFVQFTDGQDPELSHLKTAILQTEVSQKLIVNVQKDMSDKTFDIKIYEIQLYSIPNAKKIRFEIFWADEPNTIFRCDLLSSHDQDGSQLLIEKINIIEQLQYQKLLNNQIQENEYEQNQFLKDGLVLAISETNFPHQVYFMLIEPCSHIQWEYHYSDDKLNVIESRKQRLNLVYNIKDALTNGILRDLEDNYRSLKITPGEQCFDQNDQMKDIFYFIGKLDGVLKSFNYGEPHALVYSQSIEIHQGFFRNFQIISCQQNDEIILRLCPINNSEDEGKASKNQQQNYSKGIQDVHVSLNTQMESSRILTGALSYGNINDQSSGLSSHKKNMIYTVEVSCAQHRQQLAVRVTLFNQAKFQPLVNVVLIDMSICDKELNMRATTKKAINSGFKDSVAIIQKMSCFNYDYKHYEIQQELKIQNLENQSRIISGSITPSNNEGKALPQRKNKDLEQAFEAYAKVKQDMLNRSLKNTVLLYRKILSLEKGKNNVTISVLREENPMYSKENAHAFAESKRLPEALRNQLIENQMYLIKVILFENRRVQNDKYVPPVIHQANDVVDAKEKKSSQVMDKLLKLRARKQQFHSSDQDNKSINDQDKSAANLASGGNRDLTNLVQNQPNKQKQNEYVFIFRLDEIFSQSTIGNSKFDDINVLKAEIIQAVNTRLKVREIQDLVDVNADPTQQDNQSRQGKSQYMAFFAGEDSDRLKLDKKSSDLLGGSKEFDIRQLHSFHFLKPASKVRPNAERKFNEKTKQNMIYQFQKDDLLYEVYEILNPGEGCTIRLKVYDKESFKMLTSSELPEGELIKELNKDRMSYLSGPQYREELAKYIITNSFFDDRKQQLRFMMSDNTEI